MALLGLVVAPLRFLYGNAWYAAFPLAGGIYLAPLQGPPEPVGAPNWKAKVDNGLVQFAVRQFAATLFHASLLAWLRGASTSQPLCVLWGEGRE